MTKNPEFLQLGACRFDPVSKQLHDVAGGPVDLRSQSQDVLSFLASRIGEVVTKDEIFAAVWGETFVTDDSLVQCIADIRRAIGDSDHKIIQTLTRKGYRLNAGPSPVAPSGDRRVGGLSLIAAFAVLALGVLGFVFWSGGDDPVHGDGLPRIAVLAFDDFSAGEDKGYLSDAIAEGIITELARSRNFAVIARNSSFRYRTMDSDVRDIGAELSVHYLLEGSQQKNGDRLRVTAQLINAVTGEHIWAHTYDQPIGDLFVVQDQIIRTVAHRVGRRIAVPIPDSDPDQVNALHFHLMGRAAIHAEFSEANNSKLFDLNRKAVEIDPDGFHGYLGLAFAYRHAATFGWNEIGHDEALEQGLANGAKALELAPDNSEVHYALARLHGEAGDFDTALARYAMAIELNPSASNYLVASTSPMLMRGGQVDEAIARLEQAMGIDPFHPAWYHWQMGWALWEKEDCEGALASFMKMDLIPKGSRRMLAGIYACLGDVEKAQESYKIFYADADEPTISEQRAAWADEWTAPGSLDRFMEHMRIAGMKD